MSHPDLLHLLRESGSPPRARRHDGRPRVRLLPAAVTGLALTLSGIAATVAPAAQARPAATGTAARPAALPKLGIWTAVSAGMITQAPAPALWVAPNGLAWDLFPRQVGANNVTYEAVQIAPGGSVAKAAADIFPGAHWGALQGGPTLLGASGKPLLIFDGQRGTTGPYSLSCVYGALGGTTAWALQTWSLSYNCANPVSAAAESAPSAKVLAAAWPGGWTNGNGVRYRIGVAPAIPAKTDDSHLALAQASAGQTGMVNDQRGNGHFYVAWTQVSSTPAGRDGIYVKDLTTGAVRKAPGTGTYSSNSDFPIFARVATVARNVAGGGIYLAFCANKPTCQLGLWKAGAAKAIPVPSSAGAYGVSLAQGPGGRIWVAWYNNSTNKVYVTRTNKAVTRFGPVRSYATPCAEFGLLGLGGSPLARLDIGMSCVNKAKLRMEQFVTQVRAGLMLRIPGPVHIGTSGTRVTITVTDAGDAVPGATVKVAGKTATTNSAGHAFISLPASTRLGTYKVTVTSPYYHTATGTLVVKR